MTKSVATLGVQANLVQAATAALYVTKGKDNKSVTKPSGDIKYPLDEHNKLSSAGKRLCARLSKTPAYNLTRSCGLTKTCGSSRSTSIPGRRRCRPCFFSRGCRDLSKQEQEVVRTLETG